MRLQFAGVTLPLFANLDLKQAHSHLGFYGFIIPLIWIINKINFNQGLQPQILKLYFAVTFLAFVSFARNGYNWLSHALSAFVFATWIYQNFRLKMHTIAFQRYIQISSICTIASLVMVIAGQKLIPETAKINFVHGFISNIILFFVLPSIFNSYFGQISVLTWTIGAVLNYFFEIQLLHFLPVNIGLLLLGIITALKTIVLIKNTKTAELQRLNFYFITMAFGMIISGLMPNNLGYNFQIASLHFTFLTIITAYFYTKYLNYRYSLTFANLGIAMCVAITMLDYSFRYFQNLQLLIAGIGFALFLNTLHLIFTTKGHVLFNK